MMMLLALTLVGCGRQQAPSKPVQSKVGPMILEINGGRKIQGPTDHQIRDLLTELDPTKNDAFAILSAEYWTYNQVVGNKDLGFVLEYQEGSIDAHYAAEGNLTLESK